MDKSRETPLFAAGPSRPRLRSRSGSLESLISNKENTISILYERLKELRMTTESTSRESTVLSKLERK